LKTAASSSETNKRENVRSHKFHKATARISNRETEREREINSDSHFQKEEYSKDEKCRGKDLTNGRYIIKNPKM